MAQFLLSTIDENAHVLGQKYGLALELAEFCTAWNMDEKFHESNISVQHKLAFAPAKVLHAPFNELFPCAIDPKAQALAAARYRQAIALAQRYGAKKVVIHGGYHPRIYYPAWFIERSVQFWRAFLQDAPEVELVLENVLEEDPAWLVQIVQAVASPRLRLCLDVGHVSAYSPVSLPKWLEAWAPWVSHFHIHNNDGTHDSHSALFCGRLAMGEFLRQAQGLCPHATLTLELADSERSILWLLENGLCPVKEEL